MVSTIICKIFEYIDAQTRRINAEASLISVQSSRAINRVRFHLALGEITDANAFAERLADIIRTYGILRLKGFAAVEGKPMRLVIQAVGPRIESYFDRPFGAEPRQTRLVVIGQAGLDQPAIAAALGA